MLKRFLCDLCLILFLLIIGVNMDDSITYKNREEQLKEFEISLENDIVIDNVDGVIATHQIKENSASTLASNVGGLCRDIIKYGIEILYDLFEMIIES